MQRKMQETATDLTDNLYCVHIFNMFCELTEALDSTSLDAWSVQF